jgi:branched-chain amino acid transport system ATP-binding protein
MSDEARPVAAGALLTLDNVSIAFGGLMAVRSVSLGVEQGEILGVIGPNGAGKTTLFNLITGVYRPTAGRITFRGHDITRLPPDRRCRLGIARTFQLVQPFQGLSVLDNVAVGRLYGRESARSRRVAEAEALDVLAEVGLDGRAELLAAQLTLVDRKRLELARALATRPALLLLDELLAGLNPSEIVTAMAMIQRIRDAGTTVVMVEHLVRAVFGLSDRVAVLSAGAKIAEGTPADVANDRQVVDAYLGTEAELELQLEHAQTRDAHA